MGVHEVKAFPSLFQILCKSLLFLKSLKTYLRLRFLISQVFLKISFKYDCKAFQGRYRVKVSKKNRICKKREMVKIPRKLPLFQKKSLKLSISNISNSLKINFYILM